MDKHNKMLIDATHPEETRVVVLRNGRIEEFDYESAARKLLRGNIYLAKVTRVEPSLQAAFVEYGGNRHGFLAFSEIHPDYYQIPIADRELLKQEEAEEEARLEAEADERASRRSRRGSRDRDRDRGGRNGRDRGGADYEAGPPPGTGEQPEYPPPVSGRGRPDLPVAEADPADMGPRDTAALEAGHAPDEPGAPVPPAVAYPPGFERRERSEVAARHDAEPTLREPVSGGEPDAARGRDLDDREPDSMEPRGEAGYSDPATDDSDIDAADAGSEVEDVGGADGNGHGNGSGEHGDNGHGEAEHIEEVTTEEDALEEVPERPRRRMRQYKIQEVIKRRQIILVQVVKEERGNKGAALTTYISLAGRYTVLMPNTGRGGGISRKITQPQDRKRLKAIAEELDVPEGMGLIIRTAGAARTKQEIKRDYEYLLRLWESVRELTLSSTAPCLVYEEGNLIKRSIRDLYSKEIDQVVVAGGGAFREAHDFMGMLMPGHADNVARYDGSEPLFTRFGIERQLNAMFSPYVTLRSGGYLVINQTEALVAIDVNSGKATREFSIEETALNTNMEAAEEIARQLKLRDLAGLIVVDFIDMEEKRNNRSVERRLKDALRHDRARIQVGRISHFGLLEMSRQRLRTGVLEGSTSQCPHCQGTGIIRSTESVALAVLRGLEDQLMKQPASLVATTTAQVALYILNHKRSFIVDMEQRHSITVAIEASERMQGANFTIDRTAAPAGQQAPARASGAVSMDWGFDDEAEAEGEETEEPAEAAPPRRGHGRERGGREHEPRGHDHRGHEHRGREPRGGEHHRGHDNGEHVGRENGNGAAQAWHDDREETAAGDEAGAGDARSGRRRRRRRGRRDREGGDQRPHIGLNEVPEAAGDHGAEGNGAPDERDYGSEEDERTGRLVEVGDVADATAPTSAESEADLESGADVGEAPAGEAGEHGDQGERPRRGRRRGRRGGRGRGREQAGDGTLAATGAEPDAAGNGHGLVETQPTEHLDDAAWHQRAGFPEPAVHDQSASRPSIVEYVPRPDEPRQEQSRSAGIIEQASGSGFEPVAPIPAYPRAAQPMWPEPQPVAPPMMAPAAAQPEPMPPAMAMAVAVTAPMAAVEPAVEARAEIEAPQASSPVGAEAVEAPVARSNGAASGDPAHAVEPARPEVVEAPPARPAAEPQPELVSATPPPAPPVPTEPPQPPRRGWWQRRFGA